jgi:hypothetical protein
MHEKIEGDAEEHIDRQNADDCEAAEVKESAKPVPPSAASAR